MVKETTDNKASITAITDADLTAVSVFLHNHMNSAFTPEQWQKGINIDWLDTVPNHGFMLKHEDKVVGVLCAVYSEQYIDGVLEKICNPHSWCVLPEHRTRSVNLVLSVIRQTGYHFTMFSPNKDGLEIFAYLKFKPLDNTVSILLNVPTFKIFDIKIYDTAKTAIKLLPENAKKSYEDHLQFPWLNLLVFGSRDVFGFIIYKKQKLKKLPCANILYTSNEKLFRKCWPGLRTHLLMKHGFVTSKIEQRLLTSPVDFVLKTEPGGKKFFLSDGLEQDKIKYIYSELMTLDI